MSLVAGRAPCHGWPMLRAATVAIVGLLASDPAHAAEATRPMPRPTDTLRRVDYLFGVSAECGLVDEAVLQGYLIATGVLIERAGFTDSSRRHTRVRAMIAVDLEWSNRGLGGYRNWCRTEGVDAAAMFRAIAIAAMP